jgi:hypothetical protein
MSPGPLVIEKCKRNLTEGYRSVLLVPDEKRAGARQMADSLDVGSQVLVLDIESFLGQNIEEIGAFDQGDIESTLRLLLETYNERVGAAEPDPSLLIEVPANL